MHGEVTPYNMNPEAFKYTWHRNMPTPAFARLDYLIISSGLKNLMENIEIKPGFCSDHSLLLIDLKLTNFERGRGSWMINNKILEYEAVIDQIKTIINKTMDNNVEMDCAQRWELIKISISQFCQMQSNFWLKKERKR